jgi:hypothetical protein
MEPSPSWETASRSAAQEFPITFKEPEGSLPCTTGALHWSLSWARSIQSISPHHISLPSGAIRMAFPPESYIHSTCPPIHSTCPAHLNKIHSYRVINPLNGAGWLAVTLRSCIRMCPFRISVGTSAIATVFQVFFSRFRKIPGWYLI